MNENLKAFVDNEVSEAERTQILKLIENDPAKQAEIIELRQISRVIKEEAWQPQPVGLERTLGALIAKPARPRPWWMRPGFILVGGTACAALVLMIMFPVFAQSKEASKRAWALSEARQRAMAGEMEKADADYGSTVNGQSSADITTSSEETPMMGGAGFGAGPRPAAGQRNGNTQESRAKEGNARFSAPVERKSLDSASASPSHRQPRYQIKTANLAVEVADVPKAQQDAERIALAVNGRVESSQKSNDEGVLASAELTFRVPVQGFETAVNRLRKLGRVLNDNLTGEDVTGQIVDAEARMKVMKAEEDQYVELLKATRKIGEILSVKERLSQVRQEIESLDATRTALKDQAAESTIHLSLTEKPSPERPQQNENWLDNVWANAVGGLNSVGRGLGSAAVFLFVFSPIWLPVVLIGWWLSRKYRRF
ncbi:MAG: DUF4349 domain-containing protein [Fimbriimonadaceae bacterium]|nr:DUF4349 domain-containing protein [Fimbriimonadaceae bacterium]